MQKVKRLAVLPVDYLFFVQGALLLFSIVASHSCTFYTLFSSGPSRTAVY